MATARLPLAKPWGQNEALERARQRAAHHEGGVGSEGPFPQVSGGFGTKPEISFAEDDPAASLQVSVLSEGDGPVVGRRSAPQGAHRSHHLVPHPAHVDDGGAVLLVCRDASQPANHRS